MKRWVLVQGSRMKTRSLVVACLMLLSGCAMSEEQRIIWSGALSGRTPIENYTAVKQMQYQRDQQRRQEQQRIADERFRQELLDAIREPRSEDGVYFK